MPSLGTCVTDVSMGVRSTDNFLTYIFYISYIFSVSLNFVACHITS